MLETLVENNIVPARGVCESLLNSKELSHKSPDKWNSTFRLIRKIIGGVDYKGCRDLLRVMLEKTHSIPSEEDSSVMQLMDEVHRVVSYVIDRKTCLLPSYLAVNEITKLYGEDRAVPHWKLGILLTDFVQSFRPAAQLVSISGRASLLPVVAHSSAVSHVWKLNSCNLRFQLNGPLPYSKELSEPQTALLRYVLEQPYSRDMVCNMLSLNKQVKQRCSVLEEQLVDLVVLAMEGSENNNTDNSMSDENDSNQLLWQHLSSQLIFFVLFQFASFPHMVNSLYSKLSKRELRKGRDHLMWILLQFISGSIQKNPLEDFLPIMRLYDLLYPEKESLPLPDISKPAATFKMAVTCIWIHLNKKAQNDKVKLQRPFPHALHSHIEFLKNCMSVKNLPMTDYRIALLCNAYSTNTDYYALPMGILVESIYGNNQKTSMLPGNITASAPTQPLPMSMLDSLTVHAKMSLIHSIVTRVIRLAQNKSNAVALAPALVETYSRLLVYIEIESLGIKGFISQLLPSVFKSHAWGILHTLLEMFSYRLHHIQPHYRIQLLSHLHSLASVPQTNQNQLHICVESTALRLIMGLGSGEVQPQLSRVLNEPKTLTLLSSESEELNRALVLTLARSLHVTGCDSSGNWCRDILTTIQQHTPHSWASHTLAYFPQVISDFYKQNPIQREDKNTLKRSVDTEYRKWKSMASESDLINHFSMQGSQGMSPLFLCVLWKSLVEDKRFAPTAYKVLDRLGPRLLSAHLRTFADYLVYEFATAGAGQQINKCVESLNDLIWKCNIISVDRLVLCLALRNFEENESQVCFFIIQVVLVRSPEFRNRVNEFVKENAPDHWMQTGWHEKHMAFHRTYPERFYYDGAQDISQASQHQYLPVYFGNLCLRFLPVFDILIHRLLEAPPVPKFWDLLLDQLGGLYKFHDRPLTYLYNTLHYYERKLREHPSFKKKLVGTIIGALKDIKSANWCLTEDYRSFMKQPPEESNWNPDQDYFNRLIGRIVSTIAGDNPPPFPTCDWRFNEFPNPAAHALHATCIELMALPVDSHVVGAELIDIVLKGPVHIGRKKVFPWMNAIGMVLTALPDGYWIVIHERVAETLQLPHLGIMSSDPFHMLNFNHSHSVIAEFSCSYVLAMCHSVWQHASIGQLSILPAFLKEKLRPLVKSEAQFLFVCHLVGPFLQRFHTERTRCLLELTVELYEMLENVDKSVDHLHHMDPITDFLYHIKYMWVGDGVKHEVEKIIRNLRPAMRMRLRFISHHSKDETSAA
ncbi:hypothetical protein CAPTEDRAFT_178592 [Capitella teleta]|uniref:Mediator of RNA polymerase II transcription subunit 23 n=1 Tax=Capitella teleta TaxID=283909 RepID=R7TT05_CAPTE|nr:hypothetical protein CAPTEDRAFT_178592 [Capitella teleta]|eukprot:ELT94621.1 hypothetical protein CAPTEDRAFT_178592 [Capitella teleta]